ncbi:hypothetical protein ORV05_34415 [Amycolatopsis cynarae]|uniref:Uncharacterized protein n=1 Tax=Amycolatopsis cynarae TaxID=2995223 RepID=A0ABY7B0T1_9PSEU|nr:hypothetical protein [Amycolatopsis sp. HUAS 11-8]WAL65895.1 hypothetical protein ORV05_34415 [Amycolatopsis sp. HUAS 11-8]
MTETVSSAVDYILDSELDTMPLELLVPEARAGTEQANLGVINGRSMVVSAPSMKPVQTQDATLSQWFAERRANHDLGVKYGTPGVDNSIDHPVEFFKIVTNELQKMGWLIPGFDQTDLKSSGGGNSVSQYVYRALNQIAAGSEGYVKSAVDGVRAWADDSNKVSSQLFTRKSVPLRKVAKQIGYAANDRDGTLTYSLSFFFFDGEKAVTDWLVFALRDIQFRLWSYLGAVKLPGASLDKPIHDALVSKYDQYGKGDIDSGAI